jgi:hypothetical protein
MSKSKDILKVLQEQGFSESEIKRFNGEIEIEKTKKPKEYWLGEKVVNYQHGTAQFLEAREKPPMLSTADNKPWVHVIEYTAFVKQKKAVKLLCNIISTYADNFGSQLCSISKANIEGIEDELEDLGIEGFGN